MSPDPSRRCWQSSTSLFFAGIAANLTIDWITLAVAVPLADVALQFQESLRRRSSGPG